MKFSYFLMRACQGMTKDSFLCLNVLFLLILLFEEGMFEGQLFFAGYELYNLLIMFQERWYLYHDLNEAFKVLVIFK